MAKIRNGFVSNSSSSSFIVEVNDNINTNCECCKKILNTLFTIKNAREYVVEQDCLDSYEEYIEEYEGCNRTDILWKAVIDNKDIMFADIEYGGEEIYYDVCNALKLNYEVD